MFCLYRCTPRFERVAFPVLKRNRWYGHHRRRQRTSSRTSSERTETPSLKEPQQHAVVREGSTGSTRQSLSELAKKTWAFIRPVHFRYRGRYYTKEDLKWMLLRLPLWVVMVGLLTNEETAPYILLQVSGPSMLPTMLADSSEIWLSTTFLLPRIIPWMEPTIQVGDLVGFCHPNENVISCKRVIGVAGDTVPRYGQYVHLFLEQDPDNWGISTLSKDDRGHHAWIELYWDKTPCLRDKIAESKRTLVVPEGHVWVEADCPSVGVDSRHFGPIPISWIKGKLICRVWPLSSMQRPLHKRPHPIPMDSKTLSKYNVYLTIEEKKPSS